MRKIISFGLTIVLILSMLLSSASGNNEFRGRATDDETINNDISTAPMLTSDEVVNGRLLQDGSGATFDWYDYYRIHAEAGQAINASLYMIDWNTSWANNYDFQLILLRPGIDLFTLFSTGDGFCGVGGQFFLNSGISASGFMTTNDAQRMNYRWEAVSGLAVESGDYGLVVFSDFYIDQNGIHLISAPANYTVSARVYSPKPAGATNNGHLNDVPLLGPKHDWYKITLGANQVLDVSMTASEPTANLDLWIVDLWFYKKYAHGGLPFYLNFSIKGAGESEQCSAGATYAGDYYILVWAFTGFSDYTMTTSITTGNPDNDNVLENAKQITYQTSLNDRLDQSFDHYDWYKVTVAQNEWTKVSFSISGPNLDLYNISVFDSNKNYVTGRFNTQDGSYFVIEPPYTPTNSLQGHISINLTTGGDYYVCIMPVETRDTFKNKGTVVSSGYTIIFSYPNHRPEKTVESLPDISLKEPPGAPSEAIVNLSNYFKDPDPREVDPLKFYAKDYSPLNVLQNLTNKEIFIIYPNEDWCGEKTFTFGARDSYNEFVEAKVKVIVECTNDIPRINYTKFKENITMDEDTENRDIVLTDIFYDPDGTELVFSFENRTIPVSIEEAKIVKLGPVKRWFGTEVVSFTAKDGNQTENSVSVNVTVLHINHAPEINKDANFTITIEEDQTKAKEIALKEYIFDIDEEYANDDLSYEILDKDIIKDLDVSIKNVTGKKVLSILPITPNWYGNKEIEIRAKDLLGREVKGTFTIIVEEVNDPCVIMNFYPKEYDKKFKEGDANTKFSLVTEDLDEDKIYYIWELIKGEEVILNSTGETFTLETKENYAMSGDYKLRVSISDKRGGNASMEWNITVEDVNRLPDKDKTLIKSPKPQEQFKYGEIITLSGLSTDPDGDNLTYKWVYLTAKGNVTLGTGSTIQYGKLKPGTYTIIMVVDDGRGGIVEKSVTIKVYSPPKKPEPIPGFEGLLLLLAVGIVLLILRRRAR